MGFLQHLLRQPDRSRGKLVPPLRLHVGCGDKRLEGWVNIDAQARPGVDVVADVRRGLCYSGVEAIYAEHFLEHLAIDEALSFLCEAHRCLAEGAWLRLSTPNLDWVWQTQYRLDATPEQKVVMALRSNRAFYAWGHRFLWNGEILAKALRACGFAGPRWCRYGMSELPFFSAIERHETYSDAPELPHVLIAEALKGTFDPQRLASFRRQVEEELLAHMAG